MKYESWSWSIRKILITHPLSRPFTLPSLFTSHPFTAYVLDHIVAHIRSSGSLGLAEGGSTSSGEIRRIWRCGLEGWLLVAAHKIHQSGQSNYQWLIDSTFSFVAQHHKAFCLESCDDVQELFICMSNLKFCFCEFLPPYRRDAISMDQHLDWTRPLTILPSAFLVKRYFRIYWAIKLIPYHQARSTIESCLEQRVKLNKRANWTSGPPARLKDISHVMTVGFVLDEKSDLEGVFSL